jgi:hypothetical protein
MCWKLLSHAMELFVEKDLIHDVLIGAIHYICQKKFRQVGRDNLRHTTYTV